VLAVLIVAAWRSRSWLVGVFENVEVLGVSGADLETELLHHEPGPQADDATGGESAADRPDNAGGDTLQQPGD
jgi:hypothetical protein